MCQLPAFDWAKQFRGGLDDEAKAITVDALGNVYTTGQFRSSTIDFDPDTTTYILNRVKKSDAFVSKLDAEGKLVWVAHLAGPDDECGYAITTDDSGNVYTTGWFRDTVDFDPGSGVYNLTPFYGFDIYILKLDADGNFVWAKSIGAGGIADVPKAIKIDREGNIYIAGMYGYSCDFDPGPAVYGLSATNGGFVLKLNANGEFIWARNTTGNSDGADVYNIFAFEADQVGNVYLAGNYRGNVDFDPGAGTFYGASGPGHIRTFVCKIDTSWNLAWIADVGGSGGSGARTVDLDKAGNVYFTGVFMFSLDFDPGAGVYNLNGSGQDDIFIEKLDNNGNFIWAKAIGSNGFDDAVYAADVDRNGNLYMTGMFNATVDFDPGIDTFNLTASNGNSDAFICKLDSAGNFVAAGKLGGNGKDAGNGIYTWHGNVYVTGNFQSSADFDPGPTTYMLNGVPSTTDMFILKLSCAASYHSMAVTACDSFTSPSGKHQWKHSGTYQDMIVNSTGCDSVITIQLTINKVDTSVVNAYPLLIANATGASYQWLNCNSNFAPVQNATSQSFTLTESGSYAVQVEQNGCFNTSECISVKECEFEKDLKVFPNPTTGVISITPGSGCYGTVATIYDVLGRVVMNESFDTGGTFDINLSNFALGVYLVKLKTENAKAVTVRVLLAN